MIYFVDSMFILYPLQMYFAMSNNTFYNISDMYGSLIIATATIGLRNFAIGNKIPSSDGGLGGLQTLLYSAGNIDMFMFSHFASDLCRSPFFSLESP